MRTFFITHIVIRLGMVVLSIVKAWYSIRSEMKRVRVQNAYTYIQAQAKMEVYTDDSDDYMENVLSFGFVTLFSVACPFMAVLALLSALLEMRLLAYRMLYANRRPIPRVQIGIGAWRDILERLMQMAVVVNSALACFAMHPIRNLPMVTKLSIFVAVEHMMFVLMHAVRLFVPPKHLEHIEMEERNDEYIGAIVGRDYKNVSIDSTEPPCCQILREPTEQTRSLSRMEGV